VGGGGGGDLADKINHRHIKCLGFTSTTFFPQVNPDWPQETNNHIGYTNKKGAGGRVEKHFK